MYELLSLLALGAVFFALHTVHARYRGGLSAVPGPFSASMSNFWKVKAVWLGDMPRRNIEVHRKYGPVVRIGPNHVSFSSPEALHTIHGSRQAYPKVNICFESVTRLSTATEAMFHSPISISPPLPRSTGHHCSPCFRYKMSTITPPSRKALVVSTPRQLY